VKIHLRKHKHGEEASPLGSVHAVRIETQSGVVWIQEGNVNGIRITAQEGKLCCIPVDLNMVELVVLGEGYEIMHESESDGG